MEKNAAHVTTNNLSKKWKNLPFNGFLDDDNKINEWQKYASLILEKSTEGNVGLIADTGTGKTIMAILVSEALNLKTLFLAPTVILANQHADLYKKISGKGATIITGKVKNRKWEENRLIFATPHVFLAEKKKGLVNLTDFDLIFFDELHKASGDYPYVQLANDFKQAGKKIIALSASPGANTDKVNAVKDLYGIKNWVTAEIDMPIKNFRIIRKPVNQILKKADELLRDLAFANLNSINQLFDFMPGKYLVDFSEENPFLSEEKIDKLEQAVKKLLPAKIYQGYSLLARYRKISHIYKLIMTESYFSFLDYAENSLVKDKSKAAQSLVKNLKWRELYLLIKNTKDENPKIEALHELCKEMLYKGKRMLLFVNSKVTATFLCNTLNECGYQSATLFGGKNKSTRKQAEIIKAFLNRKISIIIATSVIEEGLSLPEIDVVVHYSQPNTEISRLQRDGRTGRFYEGLVVFILTDIPYENNLYYATLAKVKVMRRMFYESARQLELKKRQEKSQNKNGTQLSFDFDEKEDLPF